MRILVVGSGGREHALVWKLAQSTQVQKIYVAPGNGGTAEIAENVPLADTDIEGLLQFAQEQSIHLTVVGPEAPLVLGIVDRFRDAGLAIFGPTQQAAQVEGSKQFAKALMDKYRIPTASYQAFTSAEEAKDYIRKQGAPIVVKADGLAAGKGVVVAQTVEEAEEAVIQTMEKQVFGEAGSEVVIEEFLQGEELSLMAFVDGDSWVPMVEAQDHKPIYDGDQGPNTGGMGCYSPVPQINSSALQEIEERVIAPMVEGLKQEGIHYQGVLYAGLMMTATGPKVIEFNARFGDPETQVVLPRLDSDLVDILLAVTEGRLSQCKIHWKENAAVSVVMASGGYPGNYKKGIEIQGIPVANMQPMVFHAGTKKIGEQVVTSGGRVLAVTALGDSLEQAQQRAYQSVKQIHFEGAHYRTDIGRKALQ